MYHIMYVSIFNFNHCLVIGTTSSTQLLSESLFSNIYFFPIRRNCFFMHGLCSGLYY